MYINFIKLQEKQTTLLILQRHLFGKYLTEVGHPKAHLIRSTIPKRKLMNWRTSEHHFGYGVLMMKHMESYKGEKNWDCRLAVEGAEQNHQIEHLRRKYATKVILSDLNLLKEEFVKDMKFFNAHYSQTQREALRQTSNGKCFMYFQNVV